MITLSIDRQKIDKERMKKGRYYDFVLFENKEGRNEWGHDGFVAHSVTKEEREQGVRGAIVGNWKDTARNEGDTQKPAPPRQRPAPPPRQPRHDDEDLPF